MKSTLILISSILLISSVLVGQPDPYNKEFIKIKISNDWINQIKSYDYDKKNAVLIKEFETMILPYTLVQTGYSESEQEYGVLNPVIINLDEDEQDEIVALIGWTGNYPMLTLFKQIEGQWYLIFIETFHVHYTEAELIIANVPSNNKTFYIRWLYDRGSGVFRDSYHFYKLVNNRVYHCLELVNEARILGWGLYLNQEVHSSFKINCTTADEIWVLYDYNFFAGAVYDTDVPWDGHEDIYFVKGIQGINYTWDSVSYSYKPYFYKGAEDLTEQKIACFGAFGNDSLFISAFKYEINQTLENGTDEQKRLLTNYLKLAGIKSPVTSPTGEIEEKGQVGGLKFYGIKEVK